MGIWQAAAKGDVELVRRQIAEGADVDATDGEGRTALMHAAQEGHRAVVEALLAAGADVLIEDDEVGNALDYALEAGHPEILEILQNALPADPPDEEDRHLPEAVAFLKNVPRARPVNGP